MVINMVFVCHAVSLATNLTESTLHACAPFIDTVLMCLKLKQLLRRHLVSLLHSHDLMNSCFIHSRQRSRNFRSSLVIGRSFTKL
ncbi:hypothetical protein MdSGHV009 [Musca domestica salivary gland hypertrophy virus]|uniref:Uncharacterized protein n=1 Tax=Musca hytrovirus(isolate Musca domestica/United States/Boucias/-) TaxID=523909 RepID=B2YFY6_MHVB|nr:hypothetical protein MdSGHV009 [Musca domestica salivary gland hypertrophy virus]ACD03468.1 hypothetical protein MdSGHV009 [Musca domestica salivary gland hypertrophy virus]